jgi:hypothetical protein
MSKRLLVVLALLALFPAALHAQSAEDRIEAAKQRAQTAGIPVSLLEGTVEEGRAKGAPMDRIAAAVERREAGLSRAQAAMARGGSDLSESDLAAGADALESGVSAAALQAISENAPRERRAVAVSVLTELVAAGHVPETALQRVMQALQRGPDALENLRGEAAAARRGPPEDAGGRPAGMGRRPAGVGAGPPAGVPAPGQKPGAARPKGAGRHGGS